MIIQTGLYIYVNVVVLNDQLHNNVMFVVVMAVLVAIYAEDRCVTNLTLTLGHAL